MESLDSAKDIKTENNLRSTIYFFRQLFTCGAVVLNFFTYGMFMGAPTVIIPQIRREANSTDVITPEMASWLSSISAYTGIPWGFILPLLAYRFGRKKILIFICMNVVVGNFIFYFSTSFMELIISQAIQGIIAASITTITVMVMSEYASPKYRGVFLAIKSATFYWGVWISNAIGTFYHWRNISLVLLVCSSYYLTFIFYKESPYWLATKGRYEECSKAHRWLKGTDESSEAELKKLILSQQQRLSITRKTKGDTSNRSHINKMWGILRCESFYKPFMYAALHTALSQVSGKIAYTVYAIEIIKKMTSSEETAYTGMLILDAVTVLGMYLGCGLARVAKRRTQLLSFTFVGLCFLFTLSAYLYMVSLNVLSENKYVSIFLLTAFSLSISGGPIILSACCAAELCPLRYRSYFLCCLTILNTSLLATVVKFSPFIFRHLGTHGAFLFYAIASSVCFVLIYKYMPETKDRTIQEIQEKFTRNYGLDTEPVDTETLPLK